MHTSIAVQALLRSVADLQAVIDDLRKERALRRHYQKEADRIKTEFVSLVSHELRTPLTSIKGFVDLLLTGEAGELSEQQREYLTIVQRNVDREVELIDDLLDRAQSESGKVGQKLCDN